MKQINSKISANGQITVPMELRKKLDLKAGDSIQFEELDNGLLLTKQIGFDASYLEMLNNLLAEEWDSPECKEAFDDL